MGEANAAERTDLSKLRCAGRATTDILSVACRTEYEHREMSWQPRLFERVMSPKLPSDAKTPASRYSPEDAVMVFVASRRSHGCSRTNRSTELRGNAQHTRFDVRLGVMGQRFGLRRGGLLAVGCGALPRGSRRSRRRFCSAMALASSASRSPSVGALRRSRSGMRGQYHHREIPGSRNRSVPSLGANGSAATAHDWAKGWVRDQA